VLRRIARHAGIALRRLQEWRALALALAFAVLTGALAWLIAELSLSRHGPLPRLVAGGAVFAAAYAAAYLAWERKDRTTRNVKDAA
jgi:hypothetical protein